MTDILLTNDDGFDAIGFYPLLRELSKNFSVMAVAPSKKMSWKGKSITHDKELLVERKKLEEFEIYTVSGTPADCVQIGLYDLVESRPKLVVSGINIGINAGHGRILSSGTIGAGMESVIDGVKAIASSLQLTAEHDKQIDYFDRNFYHIYDNAAKITTKLVDIFFEKDLPEDADLLSVNIPFDATTNSQVSVTSIARERYGQLFHGDGHKFSYAHPGGAVTGFPKGTDLHALENEQISITPISLDLTSEKSKEILEKIIQEEWQ